MILSGLPGGSGFSACAVSFHQPRRTSSPQTVGGLLLVNPILCHAIKRKNPPKWAVFVLKIASLPTPLQLVKGTTVL